MKYRSWAMLGLAALPAISAPALAQSSSAQQRWRAAEARYQRETSIYDQERQRYLSAGGRLGNSYGTRSGGDQRYDYPGARGSDIEDRYATEYDASRDYRDDPRYQERQLSANDQVYRGSDGRYYCKRNDGTTGLIVGGAGGGVLGNIIDGGRNRAAGTLIGGALGALAGRALQQQNTPVSCR